MPTYEKLLRMNSSEAGFIILGSITAMIAGVIEPLFSLAIAEYANIFSMYQNGSEELNDAIWFWAIFTFAIGITLCIVNLIEYSSLAKAGEELTYRIRIKAFESIIRQVNTI